MDQSGAGTDSVQRTGNTSSYRRIISVHATSEVVCPTDVVQFSITVCSSKDTHEAAQTSVKRRTDYILQVLRNNGIRDNKNVKMSTNVSRGEAEFSVQSKVLVEHSDLSKCEIVRNLLIEKMDSSIQFTPIICHHSPDIKEHKRQEAFKRAVSNAKSKAQSISQTIGVQLGAAIEVTELSQDEIHGFLSSAGASEEDTNVTRSSERSGSIQQISNNQELTYTSRVSVIFEAHPLRCCSHKKCHHKH